MALSFSEGSIGGDIERVNLTQLEAFYGGSRRRRQRGSSRDPRRWRSPPRSRPARTASRSRRANTASGKALLLINPHTSFFFRAEAQMVSEEGLNAYGALTWGQFFIYQGFNDRAGWMHTSSGVDNIDEYLETVVEEGRRQLLLSRTAPKSGRCIAKTIIVPYKTATGMAQTRVHRLPHASRPDRARGGRQVGERAADGGAAEGADAVVLAHQGDEPRGVPAR